MRIFLFICMISVALLSETKLAKPEPSFEKQRLVIFPIKSAQDEEIHHVLSIANNILKFYGPENIKLRIVAYYHGIRALEKKEKEIVSRIDALMQYDVEFVACSKSMETKKIEKKDLIDGIEIVSSGVAEIIEREQEGWNYIVP